MPKLTAALSARALPAGERVVSRQAGVVPADYPPPVDSRREFIRRELDAADDRIEVGVAIVGGGTAGLACANRLLALLADDPETAERLGEVPGRGDREGEGLRRPQPVGRRDAPGAAARRCSRDLDPRAVAREGFAFGEVTKEAVYLLPNRRTKLRIPTPPPFRNHGAEVISVAALARFQQAPRRGGRGLRADRDRGQRS